MILGNGVVVLNYLYKVGYYLVGGFDSFFRVLNSYIDTIYDEGCFNTRIGVRDSYLYKLKVQNEGHVFVVRRTLKDGKGTLIFDCVIFLLFSFIIFGVFSFIFVLTVRHWYRCRKRRLDVIMKGVWSVISIVPFPNMNFVFIRLNGVGIN